ALQFTVAYASLAAAARLRSRRHCIMDAAPTSAPPNPPRNFGACDFMEDSCNACPAIFAEAPPRVVRSRRAGAKALDNAILQHAAEGNPEAARRPREMTRQGQICREQHRRPRRNGAPGGEKRVQGAKVREQQEWDGQSQDRKEHGERGTVRGRGEGDEHKKPHPYAAGENGTMKDQEMKG